MADDSFGEVERNATEKENQERCASEDLLDGREERAVRKAIPNDDVGYW